MKRPSALLFGVAVGLVVVAVAGAAGELTQKPGRDGCLSQTGTGGACDQGHELLGPEALAVSPDGKHVYVASADGNAVAIVTRDPATGALGQGLFDCVSDPVDFTCAGASPLKVPRGIAMSPDGLNVYVVSRDSNSVTVFDRDPTTGMLDQKDGQAGCVAETGGPACRHGRALQSPSAVAVSGDGKNVYVTSSDSDAVAVFDRSPANGELTQKLFLLGCVSETGSANACQDGKALDAARGVTVSSDGKNVYVASDLSDAVTVFDRDQSTGALTQKADVAGCISRSGTGGDCRQGVALGAAHDVAASLDGKNVYVTAGNSHAIVVFDRDPTTGALTQKAGVAGCVFEPEDPTADPCFRGRGLRGASGLTLTADGTSLYVAGRDSSSVAVFDRDPATGALTQKPGPAGCISDTGAFGACQDGTALGEPHAVVATADGKNIYVASRFSDAVAIFDRALPSPPAPPATPTPPPPPSPPAAAIDRVAPIVSGFAVAPGHFRVASAQARRGSRFRFRLSERASARILLERALPGRLVGRRCLRPTRKLRTRARCRRFVRAGVLTFANRPADLNSILFRGRIGRRALPLGSYRATITATDGTGNRSRSRRASFRIVRR
jgi:DNA-binding beta-propeller fold protein YncE